LEVRCDTFGNLTITFPNHYACPILGPSDMRTGKKGFRLELLAIFRDCLLYITLFPHFARFVQNKLGSVLGYNAGVLLTVFFDPKGFRRHDPPEGWLTFNGLHVP
jgi:hypothetical protein